VRICLSGTQPTFLMDDDLGSPIDEKETRGEDEAADAEGKEPDKTADQSYSGKHNENNEM
jgi:hypothetical protein